MDALICPKCFTSNRKDTLYCSKCGSSLGSTLSYPASIAPEHGERLRFSPGDSFGSRYRIIEEIGRGGMGRVYKAEDRELEITVALKLIRPEYSSDPKFIERFKNETLIARSITHENVIRIYDLGEVEKIKFISMDYIRGQSLSELIQAAEVLTVKTAINIAAQIGRALQAAHDRGIIHRDLKPQNVMIDHSGKAYVMDFGLSKAISGPELEKAKAIVGTPRYFSPEQAKGEKLDQRSDIYSLGIILYEMLTGKLPFEAETLSDYIKKHIEERPPAPSKLNPLIPSTLEKIVLKSLEKEKDKRYSSVGEMLEDLERQSSLLALIAPRILRKSSLFFLSGSMLLVLILIGLLFGPLKKKPEEPLVSKLPRKSIAVLPFKNNTGDSRYNTWGNMLQSYLIADLAQSRYFRILSEDRLFHLLQKEADGESSPVSPEVLRKIKDDGNIEYFIQGHILKGREDFRISAGVQEARAAEIVGTAIAGGKGEENFLSMVDDLTVQIKTILKLRPVEIAADIDSQVEQITTSSPEAMKYYTEGKRYLFERKFRESIEFLKTALDFDPEFAIAYKLLSSAAGRDSQEEREKYLLLAQKNIDRVSLRERFLIQGEILQFLEGATARAIENYREMLKSYPDDEDGLLYLATMYRNTEDWDQALKLYQRLLLTQDRSFLAITSENIAIIEMALGHYDQALEILKKYRPLFSNQSLFHRIVSNVFLCQGNYEKALEEAGKAHSYDPDDPYSIRLLGNIHHLRGDFQAAEREYRKLLQKGDPQTQADGLFWLAHLNLLQGKYEAARQKTKEGFALCREADLEDLETDFLLLLAYGNLWQKKTADALEAASQALKIRGDSEKSLHFYGICLLEKQKASESENTAGELKELIEKSGMARQMRRYHHLVGLVAQKKNQIMKSVEYLQSAASSLPHQLYIYDEHAFYFDALASALYLQNDLEKSQMWFERITALTVGRITWSDIYSRSFYWLGKICQRKGEVAEARQYLQKFLELWKDADPGLPQVEEAKKMLARMGKASSP